MDGWIGWMVVCLCSVVVCLHRIQSVCLSDTLTLTIIEISGGRFETKRVLYLGGRKRWTTVRRTKIMV